MKKILIAFVTIGLFTNCEKFLNVNPINKAYEEELFQDRSGFETTLAGVYETLNLDFLYGREMKYGFMETLVGSYTITNEGHKYYRSFQYEYNYDEPKSIVKSIWGQFYQVINQCNIILGNIERIKSDPYYDMVKGEAIGLRAFGHFQLLKLFGPSIPNEGINAIAIPYKSEVTFNNVRFSSAREVIDALRLDLEEARILLEKDPIRTAGRTTNGNEFAYQKYNSLIDYRGIRMNYYAIVALQAMLAQWIGDIESAGKYAEELIEELSITNNIRMIRSSELGRIRDTRMPTENIFALYNYRLGLLARTVFVPLESLIGGSISPYLFPNYNWLRTNLYNGPVHGSLNDYRLANWFSQLNSAYPWKLSKYLFDLLYLPVEDNYRPLYENKIISLHTIYMIAAENYATSNPQKALEYLNLVRNARNMTTNLNLTADMSDQVIKDLIFDEMRKENIGEGILFTEYKRLFKAIHRPSLVIPRKEIFRLLIPDDELLYNP